jgi:hypothetical protein
MQLSKGDVVYYNHFAPPPPVPMVIVRPHWVANRR